MRPHTGKTYNRRPLLTTSKVDVKPSGENRASSSSQRAAGVVAAAKENVNTTAKENANTTAAKADIGKPMRASVEIVRDVKLRSKVPSSPVKSARPLMERNPNSSQSESPLKASAPKKEATPKIATVKPQPKSKAETRPPSTTLARPRRRATLKPIDYVERTEDDIPRRSRVTRPSIVPLTQHELEATKDKTELPQLKLTSATAVSSSRTEETPATSSDEPPRAATTRVPTREFGALSLESPQSSSSRTTPKERDPYQVQSTSKVRSKSSSGSRTIHKDDDSVQHSVPSTSRSKAGSQRRAAECTVVKVNAQVQNSRPTSVEPEPIVTRRSLRPSSQAKTSTKASTDSKSDAKPSVRTKDAVPDDLKPLLDGCGQARILDFTRYVAGFEMQLVKIGEASFSEVFATVDGGQVRTVLKVIPLFPIRQTTSKGGPDQTRLPDALREVQVTNLLNQVRPLGPEYFSSHGSAREGMGMGMGTDTDTGTGHFVDLLGARVVQGKYPKTLMDCWYDYCRMNEEEALNECPEVFGSDQRYLVLELVHGGIDLEHYELQSWVEAASIFWQVVRILASAEVQMEFEHRDLHWGNLLVRPTPSYSSSSTSSNKTPTNVWTASDPHWAGVEVTIIDFSLSRMRNPSEQILYSDLSTDPELFTGEGDEQFSVYRSMRTVTSNQWECHTPKTTILWLQYLLEKLLKGKGLKKPSSKNQDEHYAYRLLGVARVFLHQRADKLGSALGVLRWAATHQLFDTLYESKRASHLSS